MVATCYLLGVSTRRMDKLVASLGITSLSKSQASEMVRYDAIDCRYNTPLNEAAGGMHVGIGSGVNGAHIDLVDTAARWD